ncbi:MAG TPA: DUF2860 family protein [Halioglobus sp.]
MKKTLILPLLAGISLPTLALPPIGDPGFGGLVNLGYAGGEIETNFLAEIDGIDLDLGSESIDSFGSPESDGLAMPLVNIDIGYLFSNGKTRISLANDFSDLIEFDRTTRLSLRHDFDSLGQTRLDLLSPAGMATRVYADPYQTNVNRKSTDMETSGVQLTWDSIMGSGFGVEIAVKERDIDDEFSGQALVDDGDLSQAQANQLDRNGDITTVEVGYTYQVDDAHTIRPAIAYVDRDLDGDAMSQDGGVVALGHTYSSQHLNWVTKVSYTDLSGDKTNPIFGDKNSANGFSVASIVAFPGSIDFLGKWTPNLSVNWTDLDNNIEFNNFSMWTVGAALSRRF